MTAEMDRSLAKPRWSRRRLALAGGAAGLAILLGVAGAGALGAARPSLRVPAEQVTVATVQAGIFHDFATLRAKAAPKDIVYLDALEGGQVQKVLAHAGDLVAPGQPLVAFRNTQLELDVLDREGRLVESITQLQAYEKQLEDTRLANARQAADIDYNIVRLSRAAKRREILLAKGFLSREAHDQVRDELDYHRRLRPLQAESSRRQDALRQDQLPQIKAELATLRESLAITRAKLDDLTVRAPMAGRLTDMDLHAGQIVNRGQRLGQIVPDTGFKLTAQVDEYYQGRVQVGQSGTVDSGGKAYALRVSRVNPQVKDAAFQVELKFVGPAPPNLLPGQALEGKLSLGGDRRAVILPSGAFLERSGGDWAMVLEAGGKRAERRRIRLGRRNDQQLEVLGGLRPGDRVIVSDYTGFEKIERVVLTN